MRLTSAKPLSPRMVKLTRLVMAVIPIAVAWVLWRDVTALRNQLALQQPVIVLRSDMLVLPAVAAISWLLSVFVLLAPTEIVAALPTQRPTMAAMALLLGVASAGVNMATQRWASGYMRAQGYIRCPTYDRHMRTSNTTTTSPAWALPDICPQG